MRILSNVQYGFLKSLMWFATIMGTYYLINGVLLSERNVLADVVTDFGFVPILNGLLGLEAFFLGWGHSIVHFAANIPVFVLWMMFHSSTSPEGGRDLYGNSLAYVVIAISAFYYPVMVAPAMLGQWLGYIMYF